MIRGGAPTFALPPLPPLRHNATSRHTPRDSRRDLLRGQHTLDRNDPSSPIGTFGGQIIGRPDPGLRPFRIGSSEATSRDSSRRTVGLPALGHAPQLRTRFGPRTRHPRVEDHGHAKQNENADAVPEQGRPGPRATRETIQEKSPKPKRVRAKIQRVQFGNPTVLPADQQPFSDADHQLNSQPEADEHLGARHFDAADESEISYFPTLVPIRSPPKTVTNGAEEAHGTVLSPSRSRISDPSISLLDQTFPTLPRTHTGDLSNATAESEAEQGDNSVGLLEVLSQNAMRKIDASHSASGVTCPSRSQHTAPVPTLPGKPQLPQIQHQVNVEYNSAHFTREQAQHIAASIVQGKIGTKRWSTVLPDVIPLRYHAESEPQSVSRRVPQPHWSPPSRHVVCQDLGLSASQMRKGPATELPDFVHHSASGDLIDEKAKDEDDLALFEHNLRFAGYRLSPAAPDLVPHLQAFSLEALQKRMQTSRKEVAKIIVPFSEPSFSSHATRARFIPPQSTVEAALPRASGEGVVLVWMESTAQSFLLALETMLGAGFAPQSSVYSLSSTECDLYPCPILHYVAHAGTKQAEGTAAHIALYVHLDRIEEARSKLAALDLGSCHGGSYRPFNDPLVRLLVTTRSGEPLCLV